MKFTPVTAKFTPLNPEGQFNWGVFHWGAISYTLRTIHFPRWRVKKESIVIKKMVEAVHLKGAHGVQKISRMEYNCSRGVC